MTDNKDKLIILAELLLEKEVIFKKDLEVIFGKNPFYKEEEPKKVIEDKSEEKLAKKSEKKSEIENSSKTKE